MCQRGSTLTFGDLEWEEYADTNRFVQPVHGANLAATIDASQAASSHDRYRSRDRAARWPKNAGDRNSGLALLTEFEPVFEPGPRYRLVPLPFLTFRQAFYFGLLLRPYFPECHRRQPLRLAPELLDRSSPGVRFICKHERMKRVRRRHRGLQQSGGADPPSASEHLSATAGHRPAPRPAASRSSPV